MGLEIALAATPTTPTITTLNVPFLYFKNLANALSKSDFEQINMESFKLLSQLLLQLPKTPNHLKICFYCIKFQTPLQCLIFNKLIKINFGKFRAYIAYNVAQCSKMDNF